ncbi:GNAT family N-acetyltransferase [Paenibacillus xanthanilyticus]|uniref:GNAT family N-acetyltransferase n=1 Tax=Paenibacillus xanthanilyticus TaxID=1783531 RepID=A0ABV8JWF1_9BACL
MLETFASSEDVLTGRFLKDEVAYNLLHLIAGSETSVRWMAPSGSLIYAQTPGFNGWLWGDQDSGELEEQLAALADAIAQGDPPPGVTGEARIAERFAKLYAARTGGSYRHYMSMEAYSCPIAKPPAGVPGYARSAVWDDVDTVARWLVGFVADAFGRKSDAESQRPTAESLIRRGELYLWMTDDEPVAMANIAHRSPRHARLNSVYTQPDRRGRGYASAVVGELCSLLEMEGLTPTLYADVANPASNKVYRNVGFVSCGQVVELKFEA